MPDHAGTPRVSEESLGATLARMRRTAKMTGANLAAQVSMSQPKISRIERGVGSPNPEDVAVIARALGADEDLVETLVARARSSIDRLADWREASAGMADRQGAVQKWESSAASILVFQPAVIPGLLQTSGYARGVISGFKLVSGQEMADDAVISAVAARIRRQRVLSDTTKKFHFVVLEAALRNRPCSPAEMLAQLDHLVRTVEKSKNLTFSVVPDDVTITLPPAHGFAIFGDNLVVIESYSTALLSSGRGDIEQFQRIFRVFSDLAVPSIGPTVARYRRQLLDEMSSAP